MSLNVNELSISPENQDRVLKEFTRWLDLRCWKGNFDVGPYTYREFTPGEIVRNLLKYKKLDERSFKHHIEPSTDEYVHSKVLNDLIELKIVDRHGSLTPLGEVIAKKHLSQRINDRLSVVDQKVKAVEEGRKAAYKLTPEYLNEQKRKEFDRMASLLAKLHSDPSIATGRMCRALGVSIPLHPQGSAPSLKDVIPAGVSSGSFYAMRHPR